MAKVRTKDTLGKRKKEPKSEFADQKARLNKDAGPNSHNISDSVDAATEREPASEMIHTFAAFLKDIGFSRTLKALNRETRERFHASDSKNGTARQSKPAKEPKTKANSRVDDSTPLGSRNGKGKELTAPVNKMIDESPSTVNGASSSSDSSDSSDSESSNSTSSGEDREQLVSKPTKVIASSPLTLVKNFGAEDLSGDSSSSSSSSSSEDESKSGPLRSRRDVIGAEVKAVPVGSSLAKSKSILPNNAHNGKTKTIKPTSSSSSESASSSDSESDDSLPEGTGTDKSSSVKKNSVSLTAGKAIKSDASTDTASSSDSETYSGTEPTSEVKPVALNGTSKTANYVSKPTKRKRSSSPAASGDSSPLKKLRPPLTSSGSADSVKPQNKPFSRIPQDIKVDRRFASNAYVPNEYAERAHKDLSVTKGKGFTKEKNKKKRGSYRGGAIDVEGRKGIKFD